MTANDIRWELKRYNRYKQLLSMKYETLLKAEKEVNELIVYTSNHPSIIETSLKERINFLCNDYKKELASFSEMEKRVYALLEILNEVERCMVIDKYFNNLNFLALSKKYFYNSATIKRKFVEIYKKMAQKSPETNGF